MRVDVGCLPLRSLDDRLEDCVRKQLLWRRKILRLYIPMGLCCVVVCPNVAAPKMDEFVLHVWRGCSKWRVGLVNVCLHKEKNLSSQQ